MQKCNEYHTSYDNSTYIHNNDRQNCRLELFVAKFGNFGIKFLYNKI